MLDLELKSIQNHSESQERIINALNLEVARQWSRIKELEKQLEEKTKEEEERIGE